MAELDFVELKTKYNGFKNPMAVIYVGGEDGNLSENKEGFFTTNIEVEMTAGFEASIASFDIMQSFDMVTSKFRFKEAKKYIALGSTVIIYMGYSNTVKEVFRGFISNVSFLYLKDGMHGIHVTCMDIKGIMMAGQYSKQLKAQSYSAAVKEILEKTNYSSLQNTAGGGTATEDYDHVVTKLDITDTPDAQQAGGGSGGGEQKATDKTIEMVAESDYEFVVRAAKKFNFEFFSVGGVVFFRKSKSVTDILMDVGPSTDVFDFDVEYDITGLVSKVEVRSTDPAKAKLVDASKKLSNKISQGNKAKSLIEGTQKVVIDPTVRTKEDATARAEYLAESIAYRLGTANIEMTGLPELVPGRFIGVKSLGFTDAATFYLHSVIHRMDAYEGFSTRIVGIASDVK